MINASYSDFKFFQANGRKEEGKVRSYVEKELSEGMTVLHHLEVQESGIIMTLMSLDLPVQMLIRNMCSESLLR